MTLARRAGAEFFATALLLAVVVGSGIMGERLAQGNAAIALLANSAATAAGLFVLIIVAAPISGAHLNPAVTLTAWRDGRIAAAEVPAYVGAQFAGAVAGALLAHAMFSLPLVSLGTHERSSAGEWIAEIVATAGLLVTIRAAASRGVVVTAAAVGCFIGAAYWFTSSTSFANPAVTLARSLTDSFAAIRPQDVPAFVAAQLIGTVIAVSIPPDTWNRES